MEKIIEVRNGHDGLNVTRSVTSKSISTDAQMLSLRHPSLTVPAGGTVAL
jgi:hypothetical protein